MPKRIGNLLPIMADEEFIRGCILNHAKKRLRDPSTYTALSDMPTAVAQVQQWIREGGWVPSKPIHTVHYEPLVPQFSDDGL